MTTCASWITPSSLKLFSQASTSQRRRPLCRSPRAEAKDSGDDGLPHLSLHDSLDAAGIDTKLARAAREGFREQVGRMSALSSETSIAISKGPDLAKAALHIAAEDDSLVSHSSVPVPVGSFIERLDDLSMGFCSTYMPPANSPPELFLGNLERYFYVHKGFHRTDAMFDARSLYLNTVLTCRSGSAVMLSLLYSEMLKMLRIYGLLDFDAEICFPHDLLSLPRGYNKRKSKLSDQSHIMTSKSLLVEVLRNLKDVFWPFQYDRSSSLFLRAAHAADHIYGTSFVGESYPESCSNISGLDIASSKAAQHRLERGVWTNVHFGDMRRALAACERLIVLRTSDQELRDYAVLLYHCGHYEECSKNLKLYQNLRNCSQMEPESNLRDGMEDNAVKNLMARVELILGEQGWRKNTVRKNYWGSCFEPW